MEQSISQADSEMVRLINKQADKDDGQYIKLIGIIDKYINKRTGKFFKHKLFKNAE